MSSSRSAVSLIRFISPSTLVLALLMLPWPWLQVRCEGPGQSLEMCHQSGIQILSGQYTENELFEEQQKQALGPNVQPGGGINQKPQQKKPVKESIGEVDPAPMMTGYLAVLALAVVLGFVLPHSRVRLVVLAPLCILAVGLLIVQFAVGFPIEKNTKKLNDEIREQPGGNPQQLKPDVPIAMKVRYTAWPFLAMTFTVLGGLVLIVEGLVLPKPRRRRRRDWEDDEEVIEDDLEEYR